jgi:AcrR family transcriptional regulator
MIRRTNTKDLLAQSLEQLAATRSINKIRISDITDNCGLSSPMFYYYYKDSDDIINYIFRSQFEKRMESAPEEMDYEWFLNQLSEMIREKYEFYNNVLQNTDGVNSLYNSSAACVLEYLQSRLRGNFDDAEIPEALDLMLEFHVNGIRTKYCDMIVTGLPESSTETLMLFLSTLPSDLKPYMMRH